MLRGLISLLVPALMVWAAATQTMGAARPADEQTDTSKRPTNEHGSIRDAIEVSDAQVAASGKLFPIPHDAVIARYEAGVGVVGEVAFKDAGVESDTCRFDPRSVYCNTLLRFIWQPPLTDPSMPVADDVTIAGAAGCELDRYRVLVTGNADGEGAGGFAVTAVLHPTCPGAGGSEPIPGTECHVEFPDNGLKLVTCPIDPGVVLPQTFYLSISFSRLHCGIAAGAPALKGSSADTLDFPGFACRAPFNGYEPSDEFDSYGRHASFYAEFYVQEECPPAFPGYKGSRHSGLSYTEGAGLRFADDIALTVPDCSMTAVEVAVRGNGVTRIDLRTTLDDADPVNGGVIPDSSFFIIGEPTPKVARQEFNPPIPLSSPQLWVGFQTTSAFTGPIITDQQPALGGNADSIAVHDGAQWRTSDLGPNDSRYAATDVIIYCDGVPPVGACCDMIFTENGTCIGGPEQGKPCPTLEALDCPEGTCVGDSVCRDDLPKMNCPFSRWVEGESCENEPFDPPCGASACCTYANECLDVTERECYEQFPMDRPNLREFQTGQFCGDTDQECEWVPCRARDADCRFPHEEPGCDAQQCCEDSCDLDLFCCTVAWDEVCVRHAYYVCYESPPNNECRPHGIEGAMRLDVPSTVRAWLRTASSVPSDPGYACHAQDPGDRAAATVWYKFVAPPAPVPCTGPSSVTLSTCAAATSPLQDSLIQVFEPANPDVGSCDDGSACSVLSQDCTDSSVCTLDEETACENLIPLACADDTGCGDTRTPLNAALTVEDLVPGQTYFVMVGAKDPENRTDYELHIAPTETPCSPLPHDNCDDAVKLTGAQLVTPFDLSGGGSYTPATLDTLHPPDVLPNMQNDVWYEWVAPCDGEAKIDTCDPALPSEGQPNTTMILYDGCECPVDDTDTIVASDCCSTGPAPCSCATIDVVRGRCYKIRLGGHLGGTPGGDLTIRADCGCSGPVTFLDPPDGTIDARRPHPPNDATTRQGIAQVLVEGPPALMNLSCWSVCEAPEGGSSNKVESIVDHGDGTYLVRLARPITPSAVTVVTYTDDAEIGYAGEFVFHPANVNGDDEANNADLQTLIDVLNDAEPPPETRFKTDCNHSGRTTPADMLCVIDLLNGGGAFAPGFDGTPLPTNSGICP
ncbi:MAG: hypothetical protein PVI86_17075 [Phycisphaerae bacterium]